MTSFPLKIVTPDGLAYEGSAEEVVVRTTTGDLGILAGHTNCVAPLGMGRATVIVDGKEYTYKKAWLAPAMKGRYYGGGMNATPDQDRMDPSGKLSVMLFYGKGRLSTLMAFPSIFKGEHVNKTKIVKTFVSNRVKVAFDRPVALQIDGETVLNVREYEVITAE